MPHNRLHLTDCTLLRLLMAWAPGGPLSVRGLAEIAQISKSKVHILRKGGPYATVSPDEAERIARAVGADQAVLFLPRSFASSDANATDSGR